MGLLSGNELVAKAYAIADEAHSGAMYGSVPYIEHPKQVARLAVELGYPPEVEAACLLHDVIEDTGVTQEDLAASDIPLTVIEGVMAVTYVYGHEKLEKIEKAMTHPIGHVVKFCDSGRNFATTIDDPRAISRNRGFEFALRYASNVGRLALELPTPQDIRYHLAAA